MHDEIGIFPAEVRKQQSCIFRWCKIGLLDVRIEIALLDVRIQVALQDAHQGSDDGWAIIWLAVDCGWSMVTPTEENLL